VDDRPRGPRAGDTRDRRSASRRRVGLYLYAILGAAPRRPPGRGLGREPLRIVAAGGLLVAAGELPVAPTPTAASLRAHDATVRRLTRHVEAVLPVRFGTLVADQAALAALLRPRRADLRAALKLVAGREQMSLRIYGRAAAPRPPAVPARLAGGPGRRYLEGRRLSRAWRATAPELDPARPVLAPVVRAERVERHDAGPLVASVYHLIDRGRAGAYRAALRRAGARARGIRLRPSGPWPPYAFAPEWE
jgi:Gas vesicle synthesis protein GvpL/GvpF